MTVDPSAPTLVRFLSHMHAWKLTSRRAHSHGREPSVCLCLVHQLQALPMLVRFGLAFLGPGPLSGVLAVYVGL